MIRGSHPPRIRDYLAMPTPPVRVRDIIDVRIAPRVTVARIQAAVTAHYGLLPTDMFSSRQGAGIVRPRMLAMYLCRILTTQSLPQIGRQFGSKDHSTVLNAITKTKQRIAADPVLADAVEQIRRTFAS